MIPGSPINWVELKTRAEIRSAQDQDVFEKKLMSFWIQSFLLGVPKIIVGFRTRDGILTKTEEIETVTIPSVVKRRASRTSYWDGNACINFASSFLECMFFSPLTPSFQSWSKKENCTFTLLTIASRASPNHHRRRRLADQAEA